MQAHCQSRTSSRTAQSFVKELVKPTQEKLFLKNFPTLQKNKKHRKPRHKQAITRKRNSDNGLLGRTTERERPTAVIIAQPSNFQNRYLES